MGPVAEVAVPVPVDRPFTYALPPALASAVEPGSRVLVPFGSRRLLGVVVEVRARKEEERRLKDVAAIVDKTPVLPPELLSFLREVASYYLSPLGEMLALALPAVERKSIIRLRKEGIAPPTVSRVAPLRSEKWVKLGLAAAPPDGKRLGPAQRAILEHVQGASEAKLAELVERWPNAREAVKRLEALGLVVQEERAIPTSAFDRPEERDVPPELTDEQATAVAAIGAAIDAAPSASAATRGFLLQGVTGSGKTEVYLRAIAKALARGRGALMLVPEIALTPQLVARFRARFGDEVAVVHSALDPAARHAMWRRLHAGELRVAIGARSALFAPVPALGLVIVDEEHDSSFKQEEGVRYHARDCAILRAHRAGAVSVLGSATPSLESIDLARRGKLGHLRLHQRARAQPLPKVEIVDLRHVGPGPSGNPKISLPLHRAIEATLAAHEQAILFLNRRGFAPAVICEKCGELRRCPDCDVSLTLHQKAGARALRDGTVEAVRAGLRCHYCDRVEDLPGRCPKCQGTLALEGVGTERLEDVLAVAFPTARIARLDRDVASGREVEGILRRMRGREIDLLVGTQMVTKGHDLPHVTLVGVINADGAISMPDFRAGERTFQLLVQVAGRAGRGDAKGTVLIQTRSPEHPAIACAARHDVDAFLERELLDREELGYPPFSRLVLLRLDGDKEPRVVEIAQQLAALAEETPEVKSGKVEVRGPSPAPLPRIRGRFRYRVLLRGPRPELRAVARALKRALEGVGRDVRVVVDVDPLSMM
ncbi:MAG: primosomal protein N' [Deltaproteobacteria bacterium]|nr:primosomal protein N' [Deltaproteobacteria bacterium]